MSALAVILQFPLPSTVTEPTLPSTELVNVTVLLASAVPVKVGVLSLVLLSVLELPVSDAALKSGVLGVLGPLVSTLIAKALEADEVLPATSVAVAVIL